MKILHVHLNGPFTENWGYQENLLSEEHKKMGHDVTVITNCYTFNDAGKIVYTEPVDKILKDGVRLIRVEKHSTFLKKYNNVFRPFKIYSIIEKLEPDYIINHGLIGSVSAFDVIKYVKKNKNVILVADNHEDYYVGPPANTAMLKLLRFIRRKQNKVLLKHVKSIFCINPSCMLYAEKYYKIPLNRLEHLPLGSDYNLVRNLEKNNAREKFRSKHGYLADDIIVCHGGKLDTQKRTLELVDAFEKIHKELPEVKLVIFGPVLTDINEEFSLKIKNKDYINYLGTLNTKEYYEVFMSSDIGVFPGGNSVLWQQATSCGNALIIGNEYGMNHLDVGGNIKILNSYSPEDIYNTVKEIVISSKYFNMKKIAQKNSESFFSYESIAKNILKYSIIPIDDHSKN